MTTEDKITTQNAQLPTEEKNDKSSSDCKSLKNSAPKPAKPLVKNKPSVVGKIQGRSFKVAPPRMNNSPRGR